ncbi:minor tail protein [Gordonia phage Skog]|uniref:Minor tail protein n=1 Tax=Gordonia phage Skog TaxID=2704033 RepID=A0A6G6XKQ4_9CAUD|nr:minor tail protein [Gordonia phage Skog]QIG58340.1 minor tail protein [Gordonia phage Skog]
MTWSSNPTPLVAGVGWGETQADPARSPGWTDGTPSQSVLGVDEGFGFDTASIRAQLLFSDLGVGEDVATATVTRISRVLDDNGYGTDAAALVRAHLTFSDLGIGEDAATAAFAAHAAELATFVTVGAFSYPIPNWSVYIDIVALGAGASGQTGNGGNGQPGSGGLPGQYTAFTLQRGVDIPWTQATLTGTVGAGGAQPANSDLAGPNAGQSSTVTGVLTAPGGSGTNSGDTRRDGPGPGNYSYLGMECVGGALSDGNGAVGNPPGGGGSGGNGGFFTSRTRGGAGGRGQIWLRARQ